MAKRDLSKAETESVVGTDKTAEDVAAESTANINKAAEEGRHADQYQRNCSITNSKEEAYRLSMKNVIGLFCERFEYYTEDEEPA